jgi:hypothetical protein
MEQHQEQQRQQQQQQQQQQRTRNIHRAVLDAIAHLEDPRHGEERHMLVVNGCDLPPIDRHSLQSLIDFLDNVDSHDVAITGLELFCVKLFSYPSPDGGLNVLIDFFGRSDTTLTKVIFFDCNLGNQQEASQLFAAFHANQTVTDLTELHLALVFLV